MSYTPTIIIDEKDLEKHRKVIEDEFYADEENEVNKYLKEALQTEPVVFKKMNLIFIDVEFTSTNREVRQRLSDLEIPYAQYW